MILTRVSKFPHSETKEKNIPTGYSPRLAAYEQVRSHCDSVTLKGKQHSVVFLHFRAVSLRALRRECSIPLAVSCQTSSMKQSFNIAERPLKNNREWQYRTDRLYSLRASPFTRRHFVLATLCVALAEQSALARWRVNSPTCFA